VTGMRRAKKLITKHQEFIEKYLCTRYGPRKLYGKVYFCEDEDIAFVRRIEDYNNPDSWGCVNMAHQLLVPFEYKRVYDFGRFLVARRERYQMDVYNKKGRLLYEISKVRKTDHKAYTILYDYEENLYFRIAIRKIAISKSLYRDFFVHENGLAFLVDLKGNVGAILFSKLKLPFEYKYIATPQNGYTLAIKKSESSTEDKTLYDCLLIKVRSQIKKEDSIHPTGINLFTGKSYDEMVTFFQDGELFDKECNSIICYNEKVRIAHSILDFFPYNPDLPNLEDLEEDEEPEDDYNEWDHYTHEEAMYDALGGEMEAIWNLD
jgi:hypothetical protein